MPLNRETKPNHHNIVNVEHGRKITDFIQKIIILFIVLTIVHKIYIVTFYGDLKPLKYNFLKWSM